MKQGPDEERLDAICRELGRSSLETLNALHALRDGHPLGQGNAWKWRNANSLVRGHVNFPYLSFEDIDWLALMAYREGLARKEMVLVSA